MAEPNPPEPEALYRKPASVATAQVLMTLQLTMLVLFGIGVNLI